MPVKLEDQLLKKEDFKLGDIIKIKENPVPIYGIIVSVDEFLLNVSSNLYDSENVRRKDREGTLIFIKANGMYRADHPNTFRRKDIVYDFEEELKSSREIYKREEEKLEERSRINLSILERKAKEETSFYKLDGKGA
ncbi:hypothetical protein HYX15_01230 [Candidatus Woesearchaeota archaeon]|nr:hypothetical protein [Candidatus Woesearchaeota archaeon]